MSARDALGAASNLDWLFSLQRFGVKPGLGPIRALLTELGSPDERLRCVLVAGTNGKGSVARVLAASLMKAGERVGLYTSPHLQRLGERVQVDLAPEPHERIEELIGRVRPAAERHGNTFLEVVTAAA
ncbi:MAG TPA: hypothetical protein PLG36_00535 [Trueperaceae bacterium]|nr:hypothetical protein [Trueperaceae bacterium]